MRASCAREGADSDSGASPETRTPAAASAPLPTSKRSIISARVAAGLEGIGCLAVQGNFEIPGDPRWVTSACLGGDPPRSGRTDEEHLTYPGCHGVRAPRAR